MNDIHEQYASHWQAHERNMQQVQTQAETQIQSLMTSIVGKYMKINELKSHHGTTSGENASTTTTTTNSESVNTMLNMNSTSVTLSELALTSGGVGGPSHHWSASNGPEGYERKMNDLSLGYMKPLYVDTGDNNKHYSLLHRPTEDNKPTGNLLRVVEPPHTKVLHKRTPLTQAHTSSIRPAVDTYGKAHANMKVMGNRRTTDANEELKGNDVNFQRVCTKDDLKEFWRHKLLQPNPLETIRREQESVSRNQY